MELIGQHRKRSKDDPPDTLDELSKFVGRLDRALALAYGEQVVSGLSKDARLALTSPPLEKIYKIGFERYSVRAIAEYWPKKDRLSEERLLEICTRHLPVKGEKINIVPDFTDYARFLLDEIERERLFLETNL